MITCWYPTNNSCECQVASSVTSDEEVNRRYAALEMESLLCRLNNDRKLLCLFAV